MIRFKDRVFEDYFIDPVTAVITDKQGTILKPHLRYGRKCVSIHGIRMFVYQINAHTYYGYDNTKIIHHIDENKLNDSLDNLKYLTNSEHCSLHSHRKWSDSSKKKISDTWKNKIKNCETGKWKPWQGNNPMIGHSCFDYMTPEEIEAYRKNMSIATTGEKNGMYGKHHSDETRKKLSEANKGFHWYNNGVISIQSKVELSGEWVKGMLKR